MLINCILVCQENPWKRAQQKPPLLAPKSEGKAEVSMVHAFLTSAWSPRGALSFYSTINMEGHVGPGCLEGNHIGKGSRTPLPSI